MSVIQLSVFIENRAGRVTEITKALADAGVNIRGLAVSDTEQYGIVRVIVDNVDAGIAALKAAGFTCKPTPVLVINLSEDRPGGLAGVLETVSNAGVNIEYVYSLVSTLLAINVEDVDQATKMLASTDVEIVDQATISQL